MIKKKPFILLIVLLLLGWSCNSKIRNTQNPDNRNFKIISHNNINVALGIPTDDESTDDYLIFRPQYVLSYNHNRNTANWVSWELNRNWYGKVRRYSGTFVADTILPHDFYKVKNSDYTNSGFDKGHIVRSEERTKSAEDNRSTFLLTNILPQKRDLNRGVWLNFEYYCEKLCKEEDKELFIIAGGIYHSQNKINEFISVPDSCYKIVVVLNPSESINDINENTRTIAVVMPNQSGVRRDKWEKYKTTIRRIERSTGYNYLSNLNMSVQNAIENQQ